MFIVTPWLITDSGCAPQKIFSFLQKIFSFFGQKIFLFFKTCFYFPKDLFSFFIKDLLICKRSHEKISLDFGLWKKFAILESNLNILKPNLNIGIQYIKARKRTKLRSVPHCCVVFSVMICGVARNVMWCFTWRCVNLRLNLNIGIECRDLSIKALLAPPLADAVSI
jgi:hypothetical protein